MRSKDDLPFECAQGQADSPDREKVGGRVLRDQELKLVKGDEVQWVSRTVVVAKDDREGKGDNVDSAKMGANPGSRLDGVVVSIRAQQTFEDGLAQLSKSGMRQARDCLSAGWQADGAEDLR